MKQSAALNEASPYPMLVPSSTQWELDGWYVSNGTDIVGPLSSRDVFDPLASTQNGLQDHHLVSRMGFSEWYDKQELIPLYQSYGGSHPQDFTWGSEESIRCYLQALTEITDSVSAHAKAPMPQDDASCIDISADLEISSAQSPPQHTMMTTKEGPASTANHHHRQTSQGPVSSPSFSSSAAAQPTHSQVPDRPLSELSDEEVYLLFKGSLRLGNRTSPWETLWRTSLSLGLNCYGLMEKMFSEAAWHSLGYYGGSVLTRQRHMQSSLGLGQSVTLAPVWNTILTALPLVSSWYFARLAQTIVGIEKQNGYRRCRISLAILLSVCPPLALSYLQSQLTYHWNLHLRCLRHHPNSNQATSA